MMLTGIDEGPELPKQSIDAWRNAFIIIDWQDGGTLREVADKYGVSHEKVRCLTNGLKRNRECQNMK